MTAPLSIVPLAINSGCVRCDYLFINEGSLCDNLLRYIVYLVFVAFFISCINVLYPLTSDLFAAAAVRPQVVASYNDPNNTTVCLCFCFSLYAFIFLKEFIT